jgi:hypothetical protein
MRRYAVVLGAALWAGLLTGCVEQRFVIESEPPGALVYSNGVPIGSTPCDGSFIYHGYYDFTLVKPGYETLHVRQKIGTPWYEFFPLDFISETLIPWRIHDVRRFQYTMQPAHSPSAAEVLPKADNLRNRGHSLQPVETPQSTVPTLPPPRPELPSVGPPLTSPP